MRMSNFSIKIFVLHIIIFILPLHGYALEKSTHEAINEYVAQNTIAGFSLARLPLLKNNCNIFKLLYRQPLHKSLLLF